MRIPFFSILLIALLTAAGSASAGVRENTLLENDWHFFSGDPTNAASPDFNAAGWQTVSLPHCWGWELAQKGEKFFAPPAGIGAPSLCPRLLATGATTSNLTLPVPWRMPT